LQKLSASATLARFAATGYPVLPLTFRGPGMNADQIRLYVDDRPEDQVFRVHRDVYSDPHLFELEMKYIFERTWVFLCAESQLRNAHDFVTTHIGRTPVLVTRDGKGVLHGTVNACRHKGATVCRTEQGNARYHVCPYHGWAYDSAGRNVDVKDRQAGCYAEAFDAESHDLVAIARLESYKGLVFGSLSADAPALMDFLGDMRVFIDLVMDQGPRGMELLPGRSAYMYRGNWKLQMENGSDPYHISSTHAVLFDIQKRRRAGQGNTAAQQNDFNRVMSVGAGMLLFSHGHAVLWADQPDPQKRAIFPAMHEIRARVGDTRADWMLKLRNAHFFPNMQISEVNALMLRTFRPVSVDLTEMRSWCIGLVGEPPETRALRLRQFEDFFNPSGLATPDDTVIYEDCQSGFHSHSLRWLQGCARGIPALVEGPDAAAQALGIRPAYSAPDPTRMNTEVAFHANYREWARLMEAGVAGRPAFE
jgi:phenylpropionate dioxygenase-like ring-hydroxylating dioxygenase large terminal subunit